MEQAGRNENEPHLTRKNHTKEATGAAAERL
jgi:hypothetical protein